MAESAKDAKLDFEIDKRNNVSLVITCPTCGHITKRKMARQRPGSEIECACGLLMGISGDDLRRVQRSIDSLKPAITRPFKKFSH